jgi:hypothetical protein
MDKAIKKQRHIARVQKSKRQLYESGNTNLPFVNHSKRWHAKIQKDD